MVSPILDAYGPATSPAALRSEGARPPGVLRGGFRNDGRTNYVAEAAGGMIAAVYATKPASIDTETHVVYPEFQDWMRDNQPNARYGMSGAKNPGLPAGVRAGVRGAFKAVLRDVLQYERRPFLGHTLGGTLLDVQPSLASIDMHLEAGNAPIGYMSDLFGEHHTGSVPPAGIVPQLAILWAGEPAPVVGFTFTTQTTAVLGDRDPTSPVVRENLRLRGMSLKDAADDILRRIEAHSPGIFGYHCARRPWKMKNP